MNRERFVVRDATGPAYDWLPDWCVVDAEKQVRVAAYDNQELACVDAFRRNKEDTNVSRKPSTGSSKTSKG